jgi:excisionase family DNA binding protein
MSTEFKNLVTAEVVAPMLGLSKQALYELVRKNLIPHIKIGCRRIRFSLDQIDDWVAIGGNAFDAREQR